MSHNDFPGLAAMAKTAFAGIDGRQLTNKERMALPVQDMPCQDPAVRAHNMSEVAVGYTEEQARVEAARCLQCKNAPCIAGCPVAIDIPGFIGLIAKGDYRGSADVLRQANLLPAICGRVCPQEKQCQEPCTLGKALKGVDRAVQIGRLERYVADLERASGGAPLPAVAPSTGKRGAVIGAGPAGLTVAADVRRAGHEVVIFEAFQKPGGVMVYGIPEFRLPKAIVREEAQKLEAMGVRFELNTLVGRTRPLSALLKEDGFDAAFIGVGAGLPKFMDIPGENLVGVFSANEYLTRANLMRAWDKEHAVTPIYPSKRVAVLGGGNVAMDSARMALRLGEGGVKKGLLAADGVLEETHESLQTSLVGLERVFRFLSFGDVDEYRGETKRPRGECIHIEPAGESDRPGLEAFASAVERYPPVAFHLFRFTGGRDLAHRPSEYLARLESGH